MEQVHYPQTQTQYWEQEQAPEHQTIPQWGQQEPQIPWEQEQPDPATPYFQPYNLPISILQMIYSHTAP